MTIPAFPAIRMSPLVDSWQVDKPYLEPLQTDMDGGNKRLRTRPGDEVAQIQFTIMYNLADFATFKTFALTTLNRGTVRFTMDVWNGVAMVSKTVQFASPYKHTTNWPLVVVQFDLYVYGGL